MKQTQNQKHLLSFFPLYCSPCQIAASLQKYEFPGLSQNSDSRPRALEELDSPWRMLAILTILGSTCQPPRSTHSSSSSSSSSSDVVIVIVIVILAIFTILSSAFQPKSAHCHQSEEKKIDQQGILVVSGKHSMQWSLNGLLQKLPSVAHFARQHSLCNQKWLQVISMGKFGPIHSTQFWLGYLSVSFYFRTPCRVIVIIDAIITITITIRFVAQQSWSTTRARVDVAAISLTETALRLRF